jgi:CHAT domain-containing protein
VPFEALQRADQKYVIDQAAVSYAVSFSVLREMRRRRAPRRGAQMLVAFGDPTLGNEVTERLQRTYTGLKLAETETSEIDKLQTLYGPSRARLYTATRVKKESIKVETKAATILHLATPAILDQSVPMYSVFLLSPDAADDGLLKLWEITSLDSKARVVVLPHVSTTMRSQSGSALMALSWAWFVAGSPSVVLNRGDVDHEFVYELYKRLKTSEPNSEQLRQAMLKLRRRAGYMFLGN